MSTLKLKGFQQVATYKYKDRQVVCIIRVMPRYISFYHGQKKLPHTYHWMTMEYWSLFDAGIEVIVSKCINDEAFNQDSFLINPLVNVAVQKSNVSIDELAKILQFEELDSQMHFSIFECVIEHSNESIWKHIESKLTKTEPIKENAKNVELELNTSELEYTPKYVSSSISETSIPSYVPSACSSEKIVVQTDDEEAYCPLKSPNTQVSKSVSPVKGLPKYSPKRIKNSHKSAMQTLTEETGIIVLESPEKAGRKSAETCQDQNENIENQALTSSNSNVDLQTSNADNNNTDSKLKRRNTTDTALSCSDRRRSPRAIQLPLRYHTEYSQPDARKSSKSEHESKTEKSKTKHAEGSAKDSKPGIAHVSESTKKTKLSKQRERELFNDSTDDDEENEFFQKSILAKQINTIKTPQRLPMQTNEDESDSKANKRKRSKVSSSASSSSSRSCEMEKQQMSKWLHKKPMHNSYKEVAHKSSSISAQGLQARKRKVAEKSDVVQLNLSISPVSAAPQHRDISMLSKEELKQKIEKDKQAFYDNLQLNKELESLKGPDPVEVEVRLLHDLTKKEVMQSFEELKCHLDEIFLKLKHKNKISGYDGNDHFAVIDLIDNDIQLLMMEKLSESYEDKNKDEDGIGVAKYTKLYANALLPEWILRMFMKKFNMSRSESMQHIKAQMDYKIHMADIPLENSSLALMDSL